MATTQTRDESATKMPKARPAGRSKARDELLAMEEKFWKGDAAFYRSNVDESCLLAITGMVGSFDRGDIAAMATGNPLEGRRYPLEGPRQASGRHGDDYLRGDRHAEEG